MSNTLTQEKDSPLANVQFYEMAKDVAETKTKVENLEKSMDLIRGDIKGLSFVNKEEYDRRVKAVDGRLDSHKKRYVDLEKRVSELEEHTNKQKTSWFSGFKEACRTHSYKLVIMIFIILIIWAITANAESIINTILSNKP